MNAEPVPRHRGRVDVAIITTVAGGVLFLVFIVLFGWMWLALGRGSAGFRADEPHVELVLQVKTDETRLSESESAIDPAQAVASVKGTLRRRLGMLGVAKWNVTRRDGDPADRLLVQIAARADTDLDRVKEILLTSGVLAFQLVEGGPAPSVDALLDRSGGSVPATTTVLKGAGRDADGAPVSLYYLVRTVPIVTGRDIARARPSRDTANRPAVSFTMTGPGAERLKRGTTANVGRLLAIVFDNVVRSTPRIDAPIAGAGEITGGFTETEAVDLALVLSAGALAAPVVVVEERTVAPQLTEGHTADRPECVVSEHARP
jgi:protein-export membrane protein SecD